eukprot:10924810-Alexandrium_andersonii.AAC.1
MMRREGRMNDVLHDADEPAAHRVAHHHRRDAAVGDQHAAAQLVPVGPREVPGQCLWAVCPRQACNVPPPLPRVEVKA